MMPKAWSDARVNLESERIRELLAHSTNIRSVDDRHDNCKTCDRINMEIVQCCE